MMFSRSVADCAGERLRRQSRGQLSLSPCILHVCPGMSRRGLLMLEKKKKKVSEEFLGK